MATHWTDVLKWGELVWLHISDYSVPVSCIYEIFPRSITIYLYHLVTVCVSELKMVGVRASNHK